MPMSGKYKLTCQDGFGRSHTSEEISYDASIASIGHSLDRSMPFMLDKVTVIADGRFAYPENGISYMIHFDQLDYEVSNCHIVSSNDNPLEGDMTMRANVTKIQTYAESLFFPTVPLEMLHSDAQTP